MPAIENVTRRSAVYWWRRRVRFAGKLNDPITITITVSLFTKDQAIARRRGAAMTGHSEVVRVSLYDRIEQQGLTSEQTDTVFREEMIRYRNMLAYQEVSIDRDGVEDRTARFAQMLSIYAAFNCDFAMNGFADYMSVDYIGSFDRRFSDLDGESREHLYAMLGRAGDVPGNLIKEAGDLLSRLNIEPTSDRLEVARRVICEARWTAAATYGDPQVRATAQSLALAGALIPRPTPVSATCVPPVGPASAPHVVETFTPSALERANAPANELTDDQRRYAAMTPMQAVEEYMRLKPKARGRDISPFAQATNVGKRSKPQPKVWGSSQKRQFQAAPFLFSKSNNRKPLAATNQSDLNQFYELLTRLPSSHHKSSRHEAMTLEEICEEAEQRVMDALECRELAEGTMQPEQDLDLPFTIGLDVGTVNRHFANLKRLIAWLATKTPMANLDFSDFILQEDDRDERDECDPYR